MYGNEDPLCGFTILELERQREQPRARGIAWEVPDHGLSMRLPRLNEKRLKNRGTA